MQTTSLQTHRYFRSSLLSEIRLATKRRNGEACESREGAFETAEPNLIDGTIRKLEKLRNKKSNKQHIYHSLQNRPFLSCFLGKRRQARRERGARDARDRGGGEIVFLRNICSTKGSPGLK